jgi:hypothetical protein
MAEPIGSLTPATRVPATLVEMDGEVLIPVTNFGTRTLYIGNDTPLAAVENFDSMQEIPGSPEVTAGTAMETLGRDLPEHLQSLFERSVVDFPDAVDRIAIHGMLADFADVFIGPDGQLGPTKVEPHSIDTGNHPPVKQRAYRSAIICRDESVFYELIMQAYVGGRLWRLACLMLCGDGSCTFLLMMWRSSTGLADFTEMLTGCRARR